MPLVKRFEDLESWQAARHLTNLVYRQMEPERVNRDYSLRDQIRSAAVSVMNNIVEGFESGSTAEFIRFLGYALRSAAEVQSCLYVALDQHYCSQDEFDRLYEEAGRCRSLIAGFIRYLRNRTQSLRPHASTPARPNGRS